MDYIKSFLGTGWSFPPQFSDCGKNVGMVSEMPDIEESLQILLSTQPGERFMQPDYGCNLDMMIFSKWDLTLETQVKDMIFNAICVHEPRVKPENIVFTNLSAEGIILIEIQYMVRQTNSRHNLVYPFYLEEGTLI